MRWVKKTMVVKKKLTLLFVLFIVASLALVSSVGGADNNSSAPITINEIRIGHSGPDINEYFELAGAPGSPVDDLTYLVINKIDGTQGKIQYVTELVGTIPKDGYYLAVIDTWVVGGNPDQITTNFFVGGATPTHMLVRDFTGALDDDLDSDNDGTLDVRPWSTLEDCVTLMGPPEREGHVYCDTTTGPDGDFIPAHNYLCSTGWRIGSFFDFSFDTPSERNDDCGGAGRGPTEPIRSFRLESVQGGTAFGIVKVFPAFSEEHPVDPGFPAYLSYNVHELYCHHYVGSPVDVRSFYAVYLTTETVPRTRLQSFITACGGGRVHYSFAFLPNYSNQTLFTEDLVVEIMLELDDGLDSDFVILRGEDLID